MIAFAETVFSFCFSKAAELNVFIVGMYISHVTYVKCFIF